MAVPETTHSTGRAAAVDAQPGARSRLIGVWKLRSCVRTFPDGHIETPFGDKPVGRIGYDAAGRMFAQLMRPGRRSTVPPGLELDQAGDGEVRDAVTGFVAYFGSYDVEERTQSVIHRVEGSLVPSWVGGEMRRQFRFEDGRLILTRTVPESTDELVWEREPDDPA